MGWDAPWHWIVLAGLVVVLFGYKKLPDASRSLGRSLRIFKTEIKGMGEDDKARTEGSAQVVATTPVVAATPVAEAAPAAAAAPAEAAPAPTPASVPPSE